MPLCNVYPSNPIDIVDMKLFVSVLTLLLLVSSAASAQTIGEKKYQIAVISTDTFADQKSGIMRLVKVYREVDMSDCAATFELASARSKLETVKKEIVDLKYADNPIAEKESERKRLEELSQTKLAEHEACRDGLKRNFVEPVEKEIQRLLEIFVRARGYTIIVESGYLLGGTALESKEFDDVTVDFIEYCNRVFAVEVQKQVTK